MIGPGSRLGPYQIVSPIGAGGMGEVWLAKDTRLDRQVAIKILSAHLALDNALRERFDREAKLISSLNHPNICSLFDIGEATLDPANGDALATDSSITYLVMEYLEGETLADRLQKGPLPLTEILRLGVQIASALDRAHRQGIVHRDLKPGNIVLTRSGAKLLDFGLAKLSVRHDGGVVAGLTNLPTEQKALTQEGSILGTFQYMAPEQLEGLDADARTDIFALGAVLYEMTTGRRAFEGKTRTSLIAAIVDRDPPPLASVQPTTPPALEHTIRKCLEKSPDERWQSAADVASQLTWIAETGATVAVPGPLPRRRERLAWVLALVSLIAIAASALMFGRGGEQTGGEPIVTAILPPASTSFDFRGASIASLALSPDGRKIVFAASGEDRRRLLWIRSLAAPEAISLSGTEGATFPFWSPDGAWIGFFADGKLKKIEPGGGSAMTICSATDGRGGSWSETGDIVFAPDTQASLHRVSASGGSPEPITAFEKNAFQTSHRYPFFLPGGHSLLYLAVSHAVGIKEEVNSVWFLDLKTGRKKRLFQSASAPVYSRGHILFVRDGFLMAQPFDPKRGELRGVAFMVAEKVRYAAGYFTGTYTASSDGRLAYLPVAAGDARLAIYDRSGTELAPIGPPGRFSYIRISPDGSQVAVPVIDPASEATEIWIYDLDGTASRLTFDKAPDDAPVWSPDAKQIVFRSGRSGNGDIYLRPAAAGGSDELLVSSEAIEEPQDWSLDGKYITFNRGVGRGDVWVLPMFGDRQPFPIVQTPGDDGWGRISPDGKWLVYVSNESGKWELFATRFPSGEGKWQLANDADWPVGWRRDGREFYFITTNGMLQAVSLEPGEDLRVGAVTPLFPIESSFTWAAFGDGERFIDARSNDQADPPLTFITAWPSLR